MTRTTIMILSAMCSGALFAPHVAAQQVDLRVRLDGGNTPIIGAIVRLLPEAADEPVFAQGLTNDGGRISLRAPEAGRYHAIVLERRRVNRDTR